VYIYWKGTVYDTYTYIGRTGSSTVDYVISTTHLFDYVSHFSVHDPNILSDHCVISYCFTFDCQYDHVLSDAPKDTVYDSVNYRYVLNSDKSHDFQVKLTSPDTLQKLSFLMKTLYCRILNQILTNVYMYIFFQILLAMLCQLILRRELFHLHHTIIQILILVVLGILNIAIIVERTFNQHWIWTD